jgi:putative membrane protein
MAHFDKMSPLVTEASMYVRRDIKLSLILWFCWREVLFFIALSFAVYWLYSQMHYQWVAVPFLPVGTIGTAVAFYIGFKNNSSYERLWEGRKVWGSITNLSRYFAMIVNALEDDQAPKAELARLKERLIKRQIIWCNLLRLQLRQNADYWNDARVPAEVSLMGRYGLVGGPGQVLETYLQDDVLPEDKAALSGKTNPAAALLQVQVSEVTRMHREGKISDLNAEQLLTTINDLLADQGACERLKSFPFPRQYAYFSNVFVWIFLLLLPFSLVGELPKAGATLDWMVVPFSTLISWIFLTMEQVGDTSEDPFAMGLNDVPLTSICRNIEIELLEMLGQTDLPERIKPKCDVLL